MEEVVFLEKGGVMVLVELLGILDESGRRLLGNGMKRKMVLEKGMKGKGEVSHVEGWFVFYGIGKFVDVHW